MQRILFALVIGITGFVSLLAQQSARASYVATNVRVHTAPVASNTDNGYHLEIQNADSTLDTYSANTQEEFALVYPQLVMRWSANPATAPRVITLRFVKNLGAAAATLADQHLIEVDLDYAHTNPYDPGVITHELTHVVQDYPVYVVWLTEAIANYSSQLYGPRREEVYRSAAKYIPNTTYLTNPYDTGSRFLFWLEQNTRHDIVDRLNRILQAGRYSPTSFVQLTGKTLEQLWSAYQAAGGKIFTLHDKTPQQIYQQITTGRSGLVPAITSVNTANWEATQEQNYHCAFEHSSYTISITTTNTFLPCESLSSVGHNFAYQVDMTIMQGDGGGLIGRGTDSNGLRFRVGSDGTFDLVNSQSTLVSRTNSSAIKLGKQTNTLLMAVEDQDIYLYVNGQYLGHASDTVTGGGHFGLMAVDFGNPASVSYQHIKIWQW